MKQCIKYRIAKLCGATMYKLALAAVGAALLSGSAIAADLIVDVPEEAVMVESSSTWRGVVEVGALARFAQDWDSDGDLNGEAWYPGAYASFAFWGDLGTVKLGFDGYGEILSGDFEEEDRTNANLGVLGAHLGTGDDMYAGIFGAIATYPNDDGSDNYAGGALGVEGMMTADAAKFIARLGYAFAPNEDYDEDGEGFHGLFVEGAMQYTVSDELALEANAGFGYSDPYDTENQDGGYVNWGVKAVYALPTEFAMNLVAAYEGIATYDVTDTEESVVNHTFKLGLSIPFGGDSTASDSLNPLASPRAPFQASTLADVM